MKKLTLIAALLFGIFTLSTSHVYAGGDPQKVLSKEMITLNSAMDKADVEDWTIFYKAARLCINRGENLDNALTWIKRSIELDTNAYNMEVLGDYYMRIGDAQKAFKTYHRSAEIGLFTMDEDAMHRVQRKILKVCKYLR